MTALHDVAIVGAGGFGREALQYAADAQSGSWPFRVVGFVDDHPPALARYELGVDVLGGLPELPSLDVGHFIIALGDPQLRSSVASTIQAAGGTLVSLVHPTAYVAPTARIEPGAILCPFSLVAARAEVGPNVAVNVYGSIGHDATVGGHTVVSPYTAVTGGVTIGERCFLGTHSTISPGVRLGSDSKVSVGAVVMRDAPAGSLLVGNPAKGRVMFAAGVPGDGRGSDL
jgi:sugar O-acyltransferase (sialic acid O-acetyltransferase NeuD family)